MSIAPNRPDAKISTGDRDLRGLEDAINNMLTRMHESYRLQARFVSDASHELRTPIAVIQGYAAMLDRWGKHDESVLTESIEAIKSESARMKKLVEQLLFLARGDSGRQKLVFERVNLSDIIREVYEESVMIDKAHAWSVDAEDEVFTMADADALKQVARILTENAAKYTPEGGAIKLCSWIKEGVPCFEVQDEGMGIEPDAVPHIFERFFRADPARGGKHGGTGLGLSIAKWIVDRHNGYFNVLSREGIGTRITVFVPSA
jgi:signal transduction histidine kinase